MKDIVVLIVISKYLDNKFFKKKIQRSEIMFGNLNIEDKSEVENPEGFKSEISDCAHHLIIFFHGLYLIILGKYIFQAIWQGIIGTVTDS